MPVVSIAAPGTNHSSAWAGMRSGILLLAVMGGIGLGVTRVNSWFTTSRDADLAPIRLVLPMSAANYGPDPTQPMNLISVSFDRDGAPTATSVGLAPPRIEPLRQVPVKLEIR